MHCTPQHSHTMHLSSIQVLEDEIRAMREAQMEQLDLAVGEALEKGIPLNGMIITERTVWDSNRKFVYSVKVTRK